MKYVSVLILALMLPVASHAGVYSIAPGDFDTNFDYSGDETSQSAIDEAIAGLLGMAKAEWKALEVYKENVGDGFDTGSALDYYETEYSNGNADADIIWDGSPDPFISDAEWLLIKDGKNDPSWYLFDISDWDGMMTIDINGFWPGTGSISHVALYGGGEGVPPCDDGQCPPPPPPCEGDQCSSVPEPGPLGLLGGGMIALYIARRKRLFS